MRSELFSISVALISGLYSAFLIYLRMNRQEFLAKHKPGTVAYENASSIFRTRRLVVSILVTIVATIYAIFAIHNTKNTNVYVILLFLVAMIITAYVTFTIVYHLNRNTEKNKLRKDR